jgi:murein L,D-transpeptidase YcbB/YkuD
MHKTINKYLGAAVVAVGLTTLPTTGAAGAVEDSIQAIAASFIDADSAALAKTSIEAAVLVPRLYEQRAFQPAWFGRDAARELFRELNRGVEQGFLPGDFHLPLLVDLHEAAKIGGPDEIATFDVVASDAAVTLIHHMVFGKVDPGALDGDWNFSKPVIKRDPAVVLNDYLNGDGFSALMAFIDIDTPQYLQLVDALERYRGIALAGGWPRVPDETVLKPGMSDPAIAILRQRLAEEGVLNEGQILPEATDGEDPASIYDERLQADMRAFQARHGLEADAVIGGRTFASLNRTARNRVDQLRLSLERGRWLMRDLGDEYVLVNIAGARTYLVRGEGTLWTTRSVTGSQYRKTPVFRDEIKFMEFNPTWTVPNSIFRKDKLARIRKDPGYLGRNNYIVRARDGSTVPAASVNWSANNPAVTLVQQPGPNNALGLVKFMFPNEHAVYLHDTNDKSLFGRNERNLSSGCVRLEHPFEFASLLMEADLDWSYQKMQAILDSKKTTRVNLPAPMPVLLTYWTAWVENGVVQFREDPYGRDGPILEALDR